ncbi:MAG: hypothetical protein KDD90_01075 [Sphingomonadaceae bacterium]|nr:hypothetical protein [Sphingomonadaceae bacterium]
MKAILRVASLLAMGGIVGPVAFAAVASALTATEPHYDSFDENEYSRLVEAYRARLPGLRLFMTIIPPEDGKECGYDPQALFPDQDNQVLDSTDKRSFTDYVGYLAMDRWRNNSRDDEYIAAITDNISERMSEFEAGFLRRCIEATVFSSACMSRVEAFGNTAERFDHNREPFPIIGWGIEDEIVCTYADGVAARRSIPLRSPESEK